jgi:hypothetical protein
VDTAAKEKTDLGMFYLKYVSFNPSDVFPKDMPDKICANLTSTRKECNNATCDFIHPKRPSELKRETILAIASHFTKKGYWLAQRVSLHEDAQYHWWGQEASWEYQRSQQKDSLIDLIAISWRDESLNFNNFAQFYFHLDYQVWAWLRHQNWFAQFSWLLFLLSKFLVKEYIVL